MRTVKTASLCLLLLLLTSTSAAAQTPPPDERAAAQAFADAAKRLLAVADEIGEPDWFGSCRALRRDAPERRRDDAAVVVSALITRDLLGRLQAPVLRLRSELAQAQTADPALISGRAAVRRLGRKVAAFPPPAQDPCAAYKAYADAGYPRRQAREARAIEDRLERLITRGMARRVRAAALRMRELGVSRADAIAFMQLGE